MVSDTSPHLDWTSRSIETDYLAELAIDQAGQARERAELFGIDLAVLEQIIADVKQLDLAIRAPACATSRRSMSKVMRLLVVCENPLLQAECAFGATALVKEFKEGGTRCMACGDHSLVAGDAQGCPSNRSDAANSLPILPMAVAT